MIDASGGPPTDERAAARRLDVSIDRLLADGPGIAAEDDGSLEGVAHLLVKGLPRLHPRFGFEERLGLRLRSTAGSPRVADPGPGSIIRFPVPSDRDRADAGRARRIGRRSLVGAVASAASLAVTLAGAVCVVLWRRARGSDRSEGIA